MNRTTAAKRKQPCNPFYALLVIAGVAFTITACAYALLMVRATRPESSPFEEGALMKLLDDRGMEIMGVEVLILALATAGAIGLDQWRGNRDVRSGGVDEDSPPGARG
jgi:hypothetical protein